MPTETEKLHKVLARAGLGSRRQIEQWIEKGRISIDGRQATVGDRIGRGAKVRIDGRLVRLTPKQPRTRVLLYYKPIGEVCTRHDPEGRRTVFASLPPIRGGRWVAIGRLDLTSSGLLLFTNDGELAHELMHPAAELQRDYIVRVLGDFDDADLAKLVNGVQDAGEVLKFDTVVRHGRRRGHNNWYRVSLHTGRYREVRRAWAAIGGRVNRLKRVRYGPIILPHDLEPGQSLELEPRQVRQLRQIARAKSVAAP